MLMSDLITEVIGEIGADPDDAVLTNNLFNYMKSGMRLIPALIRSRIITTRQSFTLPAGHNSFDLTTLSPAFLRERVFSYVDNNGKNVIIHQQSVAMFTSYQDPALVGAYPLHYNMSNKTVFFDRSAPIPLSINVDYFCGITNPLQITSTYFSSEDSVELVKSLCKMKYYEYEEDDAKVERNKGDAKILMDEMESRYIEDELGGFPDET